MITGVFFFSFSGISLVNLSEYDNGCEFLSFENRYQHKGYNNGNDQG